LHHLDVLQLAHVDLNIATYDVNLCDPHGQRSEHYLDVLQLPHVELIATRDASLCDPHGSLQHLDVLELAHVDPRGPCRSTRPKQQLDVLELAHVDLNM